MSKKITLLGSTGSIGTQSLDVIRAQGYEVFGLSAHSHVDKILEQIEEFHPKYVCMTNPDAAAKLDAALSGRANAPKLLTGPEGLKELAAMDGPDVVLNSVVGIAGLGASLTAIESGHDLALANKESLVTGGHLVTQAVAKHGVKLLPVDSEHSAIFQCLQDKESAKSLTKILLTASGGPFFGMKTEELRGKTKADALKHPNWNMGAKITIDSATLMNKGLELIEAVWLFGLPPEKIQIVVQRQSIVHSAVQYSDNSIIAQLGVPDMRIPIQYALTYPARVPGVVPELDFTTLKLLTFDVADEETFRCLAACKKAIKKGGLGPCAANGANEEAVKLFLEDRLPRHRPSGRSRCGQRQLWRRLYAGRRLRVRQDGPCLCAQPPVSALGLLHHFWRSYVSFHHVPCCGVCVQCGDRHPRVRPLFGGKALRSAGQ